MRVASLALLALAAVSFSQTQILDQESYVNPPKELADYVNLPRHLNLNLGSLSPKKDQFMLLKSAGLTTLKDLSKPYENLAGLMIDPAANRARSYSLRGSTHLLLRDLEGKITQEIAAPAGTMLSDASWNQDGSHIMALAHAEKESYIVLIDPKSGKLRRLTSGPLLLTQAGPQWSGDGKSIFAVQIPEARPGVAQRKPEPAQPRVQVSDSSRNNLRTYRSLLKSQEDQGRLVYFLTGQLVKIDVASGKTTQIGQPQMISSIDPAPKGDFVRVSTTQKPFSYIVPLGNFGRKEEIWDLNGKALAQISERKLQAVPPDSDTPPPAAPDAKRNLAWAPDGNGLTYITNDRAEDSAAKPDKEDEQARAQGRAGTTAAATRREKLVRWVAPFGKDNTEDIMRSGVGFGTVIWMPDLKSILYSETVSGTLSYYFQPLGAKAERAAFITWKTSEAANNPGSFVTEENDLGVPVLRVHNGKAFLRGTVTKDDPTFETPQPWLDRINLEDAKKERIWQSPTDAYETLETFLSPDGSKLAVERQSATEVPNTWLFESGKPTKMLTQKKDLAPDITQANRYRIQVTRADGFKFWVKVTTPRFYSSTPNLPAFFWFYPSEFENQAAYDNTQKNRNKNLFPSISVNSKSALVRRGWAVVEPDVPIVGPKGRINDFYVNDLRNGLSAIIDELSRLKLVDRTKLAIGGHSYGGFSTANAMVHTPFFKAGIAGAGNFNRSLTPMSFQTETRNLFEARDTYLAMSPILYAENLSGALLMYCGMDDQNVGTDPINSERMFSVLESIGKTASLYMYPYEDHGQIARETLLDMWARHIAWLDKYVLGVKEEAKPAEKKTP